jgi:hypothetical protein
MAVGQRRSAVRLALEPHSLGFDLGITLAKSGGPIESI